MAQSRKPPADPSKRTHLTTTPTSPVNRIDKRLWKCVNCGNTVVVKGSKDIDDGALPTSCPRCGVEHSWYLKNHQKV